MNSLKRLLKFLHSISGILILFLCWIVAFSIFVGFTSLDDKDIRFDSLFVPDMYKQAVRKFEWSSSTIKMKWNRNTTKWFQKHEEIHPVKYSKKKKLKVKKMKGPVKFKLRKDISKSTNRKSYEVQMNSLKRPPFKRRITDKVMIAKTKLKEFQRNITTNNTFSSTPNLKQSTFSSQNYSTKESSKVEITIYPMLNDTNAPGENGNPYFVDKNKLSLEERQEYEYGWQNHQFNLFASDRISVRRSIPDTRSQGCKNQTFNSNLPTTSIIIVFHNEAWSTLLRTVHSIIDRSPRSALKEIILVDDASTFEHLGTRLDVYMNLLNIVQIKRIKKRAGLMKARIVGAENTTGDILTFLDAHIECHHGWLEPLLSRIAENGKIVVCPVIDSINDETFEPISLSDSSIAVGVFDWTMQFNWKFPSEINITRLTYQSPIKSPAMAGGLFSIKRSYFYELGTYDTGMKIWGFENVEMSLRIWMCGGQLEILPCSHVGHIFRKTSPYNWGESITKILTINQMRLVEVWLDDYKDVYYAISGNKNTFDMGDISSRLELRKKLKCHSFHWYLKNIYPSLYDPLDSQFFGSIENEALQNYCLDSGNQNSLEAKFFPCHGGGNQLWIINNEGRLRTINKCFTGQQLLMYHCLQDSFKSRWIFDKKNSFIADANNNCVTSNRDRELVIKKCSYQSPNIHQKWKLKSILKIKLPYPKQETIL